MYYTVADYVRTLGVHPQTLRRWEREKRPGLIAPVRTAGNHRRYPIPTTGTLKVCYARVSSHDQKEDLPRQVERLKQHAGTDAVVLTDIGSGLNCRKPGLKKLMTLLLSGRVCELVLTYKDRLLRFGTELVFHVCRLMGITVTILEQSPEQSAEEAFTQDVLAILTVFSAKMHGARSHKNKRAIAEANAQL